jgi:hypothetical protein
MIHYIMVNKRLTVYRHRSSLFSTVGKGRKGVA